MFDLIKTGLRLVLKDKTMLILDLFVASAVRYYMLILIYQGEYVFRKEDFSLSLYFMLTILLVRINNPYDFILKYPRDLRSGLYEVFQAKGLPYFKINFFEFFGGSLAYLLPFLVFLFVCLILYPLQIKFLFLPMLILSQILAFSVATFVSQITLFFEKEDFGATLYIVGLSILGGEIILVGVMPKYFHDIYKSNPFYLMSGGLSELLLNSDSGLWLKSMMILIGYLLVFQMANSLLNNLTIRFFRSQGG